MISDSTINKITRSCTRKVAKNLPQSRWRWFSFQLSKTKVFSCYRLFFYFSLDWWKNFCELHKTTHARCFLFVDTFKLNYWTECRMVEEPVRYIAYILLQKRVCVNESVKESLCLLLLPVPSIFLKELNCRQLEKHNLA